MESWSHACIVASHQSIHSQGPRTSGTAAAERTPSPSPRSIHHTRPPGNPPSPSPTDRPASVRHPASSAALHSSFDCILLHPHSRLFHPHHPHHRTHRPHPPTALHPSSLFIPSLIYSLAPVAFLDSTRPVPPFASFRSAARPPLVAPLYLSI